MFAFWGGDKRAALHYQCVCADLISACGRVKNTAKAMMNAGFRIILSPQAILKSRAV